MARKLRPVTCLVVTKYSNGCPDLIQLVRDESTVPLTSGMELFIAHIDEQVYNGHIVRHVED